VKYVYGPVPSRRLGRSLGIDTIPLKTCNWNCVHCQLGRTIPLTNVRREYVPAGDILLEVEQVLKSRSNGGIDWVTLAGSGEPTLHSGIGGLIRRIRALTDKPIAVITNGSLLYRPEVRGELMAVDALLPTLDAGTAVLYRRINRPHPQITFDRLVEGLIAFCKEYQGKLWVEVMLVRGLNDTVQALEDIAAILCSIRPDEVHINLPTRPPAEPWVQPPDEEGIMRALSILGSTARVVHPVEGSFDLGGCENVVDAVVGIIARHPMRQDELERTLTHWSSGQVKEALMKLEAGGKVKTVERYGTRFWASATSHHAGENIPERRVK
jgi:wyosine [tRNA(Phe)-imidazoG37] synthetase (radical SAM superfamily)